MSIHADVAEGEMGEQSRPPHVGQHRIGDLADRAPHDVGMDLRPEVRVGAAPTKAREGNRRLVYFSTAPSSQAEFSATPSKTARTMSARVVESEML